MVSYKPLMVLLAQREMSKRDLMKKANIAPNTMTKIRRNEDVSMAVLNRIMDVLELTNYGDIMEYIPEKND